MDRLPVSSSACKELRNHHSILTISKKAEQTFKTNNSSWVLEKGKGEAMASGHGETDMASSPEEMPGPRPLQEPALVVEVRTCLWTRTPHILRLTMRSSRRLSQCIFQKNPCSSGRGRRTGTF